MTFMIDCSHYQGTINWQQVKADGCVGAYVKTTDGASGVDVDWQTNHAGARVVGIPVGPYHFAEGGNVSAEAAHFASVWSAGWDLHPVLDYEIASANANWLSAFRTYFRQDTGFDPFRVYSSEGFLTGQLNPAGWIDSDTTIWAARYAPSLGWNHPSLVIWQYTSAANIPGVLGNVDESEFVNGWLPADDQGGTVNWTDEIPFDGTTAMAQDCIANADLYAGKAMNAVLDPVSGLAALHAQLSAIQGALSADEAALLAAVKGVQAGTVDTAALAQALVPLLAPADAAAFQADLAAALAK